MYAGKVCLIASFQRLHEGEGAGDGFHIGIVQGLRQSFLCLI